MHNAEMNSVRLRVSPQKQFEVIVDLYRTLRIICFIFLLVH